MNLYRYLWMLIGVLFTQEIFAQSRIEINNGHFQPVIGIKTNFSKTLLTSFDARTVKIWKIESKWKIAEIKQDSNILDVTFHQNDIIILRKDSLIQWNFHTNRIIWKAENRLALEKIYSIYNQKSFHCASKLYLYQFNKDNHKNETHKSKIESWLKITKIKACPIQNDSFIFLINHDDQLVKFQNQNQKLILTKISFPIFDEIKYDVDLTNNYFAFSNQEHKIFIYELNHSKKLIQIDSVLIHSDLINDLKFSSYEGSIYSASADYFLNKHHIKDGKNEFNIQEDYVNAIVVLKNQIISCCYSSSIRMHNHENLNEYEYLGNDFSRTQTSFFHEKSNSSIVGFRDGSLSVYDYRNVKKFQLHLSNSIITQITLANEESVFVSTMNGEIFRVSMNGKKSLILKDKNPIFDILKLNQKNIILVVTQNSIYRFDEIQNIKIDSISILFPWTIEEFDNHIFVGGESSFVYLDNNSKGKLVLIKPKNDLKVTYIGSFFSYENQIFLKDDNDKIFQINLDSLGLDRIILKDKYNKELESITQIQNLKFSKKVLISTGQNELYEIKKLIDHCFYLEQNKIVSKSKIKGLEDYISSLEGDDIWCMVETPNKHTVIAFGEKIFIVDSNFNLIDIKNGYHGVIVNSYKEKKSIQLIRNYTQCLITTGIGEFDIVNLQNNDKNIQINDLHKPSNLLIQNILDLFPQIELSILKNANILENGAIQLNFEYGSIFFYMLENHEWLMHDIDYRYDASSDKTKENLLLVCENNQTPLTAFNNALYIPNLLNSYISGKSNDFAKLKDFKLCEIMPKLELILNDSLKYVYRCSNHSNHVSQYELWINHRFVEILTYPSNGQFIIEKRKIKSYLYELKNSIEIRAKIKLNGTTVVIRGAQIACIENNEKNKIRRHPKFYGIYIGVSEYSDPKLNLTFSQSDAEDLALAMKNSVGKLLGDSNVNQYLFTDKNELEAKSKSPNRENIYKTFKDIGKKINLEDFLFIYFAGHGVMNSKQNSSFTLLTNESTSDSFHGISTEDLEMWLSPSGEMGLKANKVVLVFDACNSGAVLNEMTTFIKSRDVTETKRIKAVEDLKDKSGVFILAASQPNQSALEITTLKHGILTYSLLKTLKDNPLILDDGDKLNVSKWFSETEISTREIADRYGFKQNARPIGNSNFQLGVVDESVTKSILLPRDKPVVRCIYAGDENGNDTIDIKEKLNLQLLDFSNNPNSKFLYTSVPFKQSYSIVLFYNISKSKCQFILRYQNLVKFSKTLDIKNEDTMYEEINSIINNWFSKEEN